MVQKLPPDGLERGGVPAMPSQQREYALWFVRHLPSAVERAFVHVFQQRA
jgi:hypothetical protein